MYKLLQTLLGIKNNWFRRHSYNSDTINAVRPGHHHNSVLDYLITSFLRIPFIIYKILFKTLTVSLCHYVWCVYHTHSISHNVPQ